MAQLGIQGLGHCRFGENIKEGLRPDVMSAWLTRTSIPIDHEEWERSCRLHGTRMESRHEKIYNGKVNRLN